MSSDEAELAVPTEFSRLAAFVHDKLEGFATGDEDLRASALAATKHAFDMGKCLLYVYVGHD
jgi:hypothetical protein